MLEPNQELRTIGDVQLVAPRHCGAVGARVSAIPAVLYSACDSGRALQAHHEAVAAAQALVALLIARLPAGQEFTLVRADSGASLRGPMPFVCEPARILCIMSKRTRVIHDALQNTCSRNAPVPAAVICIYSKTLTPSAYLFAISPCSAHHNTRVLRTLITMLPGCPASARDSPRPFTRHSLGSASDCTHASASHAPRKTVLSAKRQAPWPCRLSSAQSPAAQAARHRRSLYADTHSLKLTMLLLR